MPERTKEQFSYDEADNIYSLPDLDWKNTHGGKPDAFRSNRLPFWKHNGFTYDGFGNLIQRTQGSITQQFEYDDENRLLRAWGDGPKGKHDTRYHYDALGRRTEKAVRYQESDDVISTRFRWQGLRLIQEVTPEHTRTYLYDPNEGYTPLARVTLTGDEQKVDYFHTDLNGTPLDVTDTQGNIVWCGKYTAWGKLQPQIHLDEEIPGLPYQPLRYPGQYYDDETGLHYNTFRYYDPEVGRFTTQDPIGLNGGLNLYAYAVNATKWIDPLGLSVEWVDPSEINFSQRTISSNNYAELMKSGQWDWSQSPLNVIDMDGQLVTYDNRRLDAALEAGLDKVPITKVDPSAPHPDSTTGKTWLDKFKQRFRDKRNKKAGGVVPDEGLSQRPTKC